MTHSYSAELSEKIIRGLTGNALKAKYNGGSLPFGYTIDDERHLQLDPVTAPVAREIFERYADGESIVNIAQSPTSEGFA